MGLFPLDYRPSLRQVRIEHRFTPPSHMAGALLSLLQARQARVAELADAQDSGSCGNKIPWGFDSPPEHSVGPRWRNWQTRQLEGLVPY